MKGELFTRKRRSDYSKIMKTTKCDVCQGTDGYGPLKCASQKLVCAFIFGTICYRLICGSELLKWSTCLPEIADVSRQTI